MSNIIHSLNRMQNVVKNKTHLYLKKEDSALIVSATGTGKTEMATKIIMSLPKATKVLWLTHQNELVKQVAERLTIKTDRYISIFNSEFKELGGDVVIASIQSLSKPNVLKKISRNAFDYVFVDECHHAPASTWLRTIQHFNCKKIGLTATYKRPDGLSVSDIFGNPIFELPFEKAQEKGFLAKDQNRLILTNSVINGVSILGRDYTAKQLDKLYTSKDRNNIIVKAYLKHGRAAIKKAGMKPKGVCFCINIDHAIRMSEMFNKHGISSSFVCGNSRKQSVLERDRIMDSFRTTNDIEILCVVNIFNEGIDIPEANVGLMARPTRSNIIYQQQVGRIARPDEGRKKFFVVLDFVDVTSQEYSGYVMGSLKQVRAVHSQIITEYVSEADPVVINKRVDNIMQTVRQFENIIDLPVNDQNKKEHLEALARGNVLKRKQAL